MQQLTDEYTSARAVVAAEGTHNWRRGFTDTYLLLAARHLAADLPCAALP